MPDETTLWGLHAGKTGDAHSLFLRENVVALGWEAMPDLSTIPPDREAFKRVFAERHPNAKAGAIPTSAGQLFRFAHEMVEGDLVAYPSKTDREMHIARVTGPYFYAPSSGPGYPHRRRVEWVKSVPRTKFSQGALYEIGSAMSFFQIKNYADEYFTLIEGRAPAPVEVEEEESVGLVVENIEEQTRDFVLKTLARDLKGHPFAAFVGHLLEAMGYRTRVSPEGPDGGIDVIAHRDELGFEPPIIKVQVKSKEGTCGDPEVSALYGKVDHGEYGLFVTLGTFSNQAKQFARNKSNLRLIDGDELVELIVEHYDELPPGYRSKLPLRRVYVPEVVGEE